MSVKDREQSREALVRHDPAQKLYGIALFGEAGEGPDNDDPELSVLDHPIPDELAEEARQLEPAWRAQLRCPVAIGS